jgi:hypothetical protein
MEGFGMSAGEFSGDTTYYKDYPHLLTTRFYTSRKYTSLIINQTQLENPLSFEPNSTLNLGMGATYNDLTLNIAFGFGFMNPEQRIFKSDYLDLQAHLYPKNLVIDLFAQFYKGYILGTPSSEPDQILLPEMRLRKFGSNFQYLFNGDKVSLKAAFLQSAWQQRSGGSALAGFEIYGGFAENPFSLIPSGMVSGEFSDFKALRFFQFGPNLGYVHTLVIKKHFFITAMFSGNLSLGNQQLENDLSASRRWGLNTNMFLRGFAGYNSERWSINANYVRNTVRLVKNSGFSNDMNTGNYRINFVYRFDVAPKLKSVLDFANPTRLIPGRNKYLR